MSSRSSKLDTRPTFVLVHGAWAGAWAWTRVADRLAAGGQRARAPALSGLGERCHLAGNPIDLTTHVNDVVNEILWKDLGAVVLVGHSYGGFVITGVAERVAERLAAIVYVDAFIPSDGQSFADIAPWLDPAQPMTQAPPTAEGDYLNPGDRAWVDQKATAQPTATFTEKLSVGGAYQRVARKTFIQATGWDSPFGSTAAALRADSTWAVHEIACGHDVAIDKPDELTALLLLSVPTA